MQRESKYGYSGLLRAIEKNFCLHLNIAKMPPDAYAFTTDIRMRILLDEMVHFLEEKEKRVVQLYYGLNGETHSSFRDIQEQLRCSRVTIDTARRSAIARLSTFPYFSKLLLSKDILQKNSKIEVLGLSSRAYHSLKKAGINTISELLHTVKYEPERLSKIKYCGENTIKEINGVAKEIRLKEALRKTFITDGDSIRFKSNDDVEALKDVLAKYLISYPEGKNIKKVEEFYGALSSLKITE